MAKTYTIILGVALALLVLIVSVAGWVWWLLGRSSPQYEGEQRLAGLEAPVTVLRDARGVPHVYAESLDDLLFAQGFLTAEERLWQMDMLRRMARGELAEILGRSFLGSDKENRTLGLSGVADRIAELLDSESRGHLETYARGVNAYIESHRGRLPIEFDVLGYEPRPWTPADSLAIGLDVYKLLTTTWPGELRRARVAAKLSPELLRDLYVVRAPQDRPVAEPSRRPQPRERRRVYLAGCPHRVDELPGRSAEALAAFAAGSNNWVVAGARTASGKPLLANDPHLLHMLPAVWFAIHLKSPELNVAGVSLPGIPFVIIGHNERIAWGVTNLWPDVQDLYVERFHPNDPNRYLTPGGWQPVGRRVETMHVRGEADVQLEVLRTRHGPIVHDDGQRKLALRWAALDPELYGFPFYEINRAQTWDEFRAALALYGGPTQNVVYADGDGNIGYVGAGRVPVRRQGRGEVPLPGETNGYDWLGTIPFPEMPQAFNPTLGIIATANNRVVPDDYPIYLTDRWDAPYRAARLYELLENQTGFKPEDFLRLQGDIASHVDLFLAQQLAAAAQNAPELAEAVEIFRGWDGQMRATDTAPLLTDTARRVLLEKLLRPKLGDDWNAYSWPSHPVFIENVLRNRPGRWLPPDYPDYDALLRATLTQTVEELRREFRATSLRGLRWGQRLTVRFAHPFGLVLPRFLSRWINLGGPQSGGRYAVKQMTRQFGPSMRMIVDLANFDNSLLNLTVGQSGHFLSPHYRDQYTPWDSLQSFPFPFSDAAVQQAARHRLRLLPQR